jgi:hypothetical protein
MHDDGRRWPDQSKPVPARSFASHESVACTWTKVWQIGHRVGFPLAILVCQSHGHDLSLGEG